MRPDFNIVKWHIGSTNCSHCPEGKERARVMPARK